MCIVYNAGYLHISPMYGMGVWDLLFSTKFTASLNAYMNIYLLTLYAHSYAHFIKKAFKIV